MFVWTFLLRITHTIISQSSADSSWITLYVVICATAENGRSCHQPCDVNQIHQNQSWRVKILAQKWVIMQGCNTDQQGSWTLRLHCITLWTIKGRSLPEQTDSPLPDMEGWRDGIEPPDDSRQVPCWRNDVLVAMLLDQSLVPKTVHSSEPHH